MRHFLLSAINLSSGGLGNKSTPPPPQKNPPNLLNVLIHYIGNIFRRLHLPVKLAEKIYAVYWSKYGKFHKRAGLYIEMHLADHCNLNCVFCSHYSPLSETKFVDIVQYENDFKRLAELGADKLETLRLMGGEPLLNKEINRLTVIARKYFPKSKIQIVTNGTLLLKQDEDFWETCGKHNIEIFISYYPIKLDYDAIKLMADKHRIKLTLNIDNNNAAREMSKFELDINGRQDCKESFRKCEAANSCVNLRDGKIYPCPTAAHIEIFNKYFDRHLELSPKDYIDIYEARSMDEIFEFLKSPVPFCRFCTHNNVSVEWRASKKEISEWTNIAEPQTKEKSEA